MLKAFLVLLCELALAQTPTAPSVEVGSANLPVHAVGANDLIAISVYGHPEFTRTARVTPEGYIRLPMLPQPIQAEGLLPSELEIAIGEALRAEQILVDPFVTVNIAEYHSRPISVAGAVKNEVTFQALRPVTLLDALTRAGGLSAIAGPDILVTRSQPGGTRSQPGEGGKRTTLTQRIPVKGLIGAADPELNVLLHGGEEIRVPEVGRVIVVGNVKKPGSFPIQGASETTVLQVLALAEGLAPFAGKQAYIYRREASGAKNEIPVELRKILERKTPDVPLMVDDILYIPDNRSRRVSMAALEKVVGFGAGTLSGVLIYSSIR